MDTFPHDFADLERLIDGGAAKDEIRSQIRFLAREVAALVTDCASLAEAHTQLQQAHTQLQQAHTQLQQAHTQSDSERWNKVSRDMDIPTTYLDPSEDI